MYFSKILNLLSVFFGLGGGKITNRALLVMLFVLSLALLSVNNISAVVNNQTGNITNSSKILQNNANTTCITNLNVTNSRNMKNRYNSTEAAGDNTTKNINYKNIHGIWLTTSYTNNLDIATLKKYNITDIFFKCNLISTPTYQNVLPIILNELKGTGIRVHAWITCFIDVNGNWINPANATQQQFLINSITTIVKNYNVSGIHLDYVRYPGTSYKYTNGTGTITSFVKRVYTTVKSINPSVAISAALMPEGSVNAYYYGQNYTQLAPYLDFMVPMVYKGNYGYNSSIGTNSKGQNGTDWISSTIAYIVSQANGTPVVAGLQAYRCDNNITPIPASELQNDINAALSNGSSGFVLFRYGLISSDFTFDSTAPKVIAVDPANKTTNVPSNKVIKVTCNEAIKTGTNWIELKNSNGTSIPITKSINGNILTIIPTKSLPEDKYFLILHTSSITDLAGNPIALWSSKFITGTSPKITTVDPANNSVNIPVNKVIKVTFNEAIKTGTNWIELKNSNGTSIPITKSLSGNVLTIIPTNNLIKGTKYTLIIHTGSITDLTGNPITLYTSSFTTSAK